MLAHVASPACTLLEATEKTKAGKGHAAMLIRSCKGVRPLMTTLTRLEKMGAKYASMKELVDGVIDAAEHAITVDEDMRDEIMDLLSEESENLFSDPPELSFTKGDLDDVIFLTFGTKACAAALYRLVFARKKFATFLEMVAHIPHVPHPTAAAREALLALLREGSVVDPAGLAAPEEQVLNDILLVGGGVELITETVRDMQSQKMTFILEELGNKMVDFIPSSALDWYERPEDSRPATAEEKSKSKSAMGTRPSRLSYTHQHD